MDVEQGLKTINREELKEKIDWKEQFFLVETLGEEKYRQAHLPGAFESSSGSAHRIGAVRFAGQERSDHSLLLKPHLTCLGQCCPCTGRYGVHQCCRLLRRKK